MTRMKFKFVSLVFLFLFIIGFSPAGHGQSDSDSDEESVPFKPVTGVAVEALVVQIVLNDEHRQGVDWEAIVADFHRVQLKQRDNPLWVDKKYRISVGTVSDEDYAVLIDALDTVGHMTQTPQQALALVPDAKQTLNIVLGNTIAENLRVDLQLFNTKTETRLLVEPFVGVTLKDSNGKTVPVTLKGSTEILLKDRTSVVLGGITSEQEITKTHKFPLLGDLPLVGLVFRNKGRLMQKIETIIFLTPKINREPETHK
jgi:type II secretory pathway component GspD/PulD (secretin)